MKILYYTWNEYCRKDLYEGLIHIGVEVDKFSADIVDKLRDDSFADVLQNKIETGEYDCIFTFNYYPVISDVAQRMRIKYISWIFDSPHITLYTRSVFNDCNYIFLFDKSEVLRLESFGVKNIFHMPLAVNMERLDRQLLNRDRSYINEVSFLGNLYNDEYNFFDLIKNMPQYCKGYFDALMRAQMNIFGYDLASELITADFYEKECSFVSFDLDKDVFLPPKDIFVHFLQKKITVMERVEILELISTHFPITHYNNIKAEGLDRVKYGGYLDYYKQMPEMFYDSKINLNITLRSIQSGIPLRCMDIMGAGGFLLSNWQPELDEFFENGTDMVMYDSRWDLLYKIDYYLSHGREREEIAEMGKRKIRDKFSYEILLHKILKLAGLQA